MSGMPLHYTNKNILIPITFITLTSQRLLISYNSFFKTIYQLLYTRLSLQITLLLFINILMTSPVFGGNWHSSLLPFQLTYHEHLPQQLFNTFSPMANLASLLQKALTLSFTEHNLSLINVFPTPVILHMSFYSSISLTCSMKYQD